MKLNHLKDYETFKQFYTDCSLLQTKDILNKWNTSKDSVRRVRISIDQRLPIYEIYEARVKHQPKEKESINQAKETFNIHWSEEYVNGGIKHTSVSEIPITTLEELFAHTKHDPELWTVPKWGIRAYVAYIKNAQKEIETKQMFSVWAEFKPRVEVIETKQILADLVEEMKQYSPVVKPIKYLHPEYLYSTKPNKRLLEISPFDLHFNKLCWDEETGENFDTEIAAERFNTAMDDLISRAVATGPIDNILFVVGQDLFNTDGNSGTTTGGTPQSTDSRHHKVFKKVLRLKIDTILRLSQIAPVDVKIIPGNHDEETTSYLGMALEVYFENNANVTIDASALKRKYYQYGKVMLCFTHGDKEKLADLPLIIATENPQVFGVTKYREIHTGHRHTTKTFSKMDVDENHGVRVRILPSLTATDSWHKGKGFIGNLQACEAYLWDSEKGLDTILIHNV